MWGFEGWYGKDNPYDADILVNIILYDATRGILSRTWMRFTR